MEFNDYTMGLAIWAGYQADILWRGLGGILINN